MDTPANDNDNATSQQDVEMLRAAAAKAAEDILKDIPTEQTVAEIQSMGLDPEDAAAVYAMAYSAIKKTHKRTGATYIVIGALWVLVGAMVLLVKFAVKGAATDRFVGLMIFLACLGLIQIGIGLLRLRRANKL